MAKKLRRRLVIFFSAHDYRLHLSYNTSYLVRPTGEKLRLLPTGECIKLFSYGGDLPGIRIQYAGFIPLNNPLPGKNTISFDGGGLCGRCRSGGVRYSAD